jgi:hypothetical protein
MPVTRHPPHRPGRAVFPHPVPRLYSLPRQTTHVAWFAIPRREVGLCYSSPTGPAPVSFAGSVLPSGPSPWGGLSPPPSTLPDKTPHWQPAGVPLDRTSPPACAAVPSVHGGSGLTPFPGFPFRALLAVSPIVGFPAGQEPRGPPGFADASLPAGHGLGTPADLHTLATTGASCGLRARYNPRHPQPAYLEAVPALPGARPPLRPTGCSASA